MLGQPLACALHTTHVATAVQLDCRASRLRALVYIRSTCVGVGERPRALCRIAGVVGVGGPESAVPVRPVGGLGLRGCGVRGGRGPVSTDALRRPFFFFFKQKTAYEI